MTDLIAEARQLLQQAEQYINTPDQPMIDDHQYKKRSAAGRSQYQQSKKPKQAAAKPKSSHTSPYQQGRKYCGKCGVFKAAKGDKCPECGRPLRLKPKAASIKRRRKRHAKKK